MFCEFLRFSCFAVEPFILLGHCAVPIFILLPIFLDHHAVPNRGALITQLHRGVSQKTGEFFCMFSPSSFKENSYTEFVELGAVNFSYLQLAAF
jgi:hypothetical protein